MLAEAKGLGLLDGEKNAHVSFRVPLALLEAAKQEAGVVSTSEVGVLALALLAQTDPVVAFFRRTRGRSGETTRSMSDFEGSIRRRKPEKRVDPLAVRPRADLIGAGDLASTARVALLVDTNVYIREAAGTMPSEVETLLDRALLFHCSVCIAELATGIGNMAPTHPTWAESRDHYIALIAAIPPTRLLTPDARIWTDAGLTAGIVARTRGFQPHKRRECLNDALIYLTAAKAGMPVLTSNRDEFDLIGQLVPEGAFVHY